MNKNFERDLTTIYKLNDEIFDSRARLLVSINNNHKHSIKIDKKYAHYIEHLCTRLNKLKLMRHDEIMRLYSNVKLTRTIQPLPPIKQSNSYPRKLPKINKQQLKSIAKNPNIDNEVIYPDGIIDYNSYSIVARYRKSIGKSTDFRENPLLIGEDSTETLIIGLDHFTQQHNCILSFTNMDEVFDQSIFDAPCDVFELNSIHLLISHILITAHFKFELEFDHRSTDTLSHFVYEFRHAIANVLACRVDYIRIFSIEKLPNKPGTSQIHFGLTTINQLETEYYVQQLLTIAVGGFSIYDEILQCIVPRQYECIWKPLQAYFQIEPCDLEPQYNFDFRTSDLPKQLSRGNHCYYLPIGWYRFGINVKTKYGDDRNWLSYINARGEWSVAFLGTSPVAIDSNTKGGELLTNVTRTDQMKIEAIQSSDDEVDSPGLYVTTHCTNGADRYAIPFHVENEQFQIVFQCRIEPLKFTIHKGFVKTGDVWRIVDARAIRPYGILVRKT